MYPIDFGEEEMKRQISKQSVSNPFLVFQELCYARQLQFWKLSEKLEVVYEDEMH